MKAGSQRTYHYIYKITRLDDSGRFYLGMHSSDKPNDRYFGSGKIITASIKKHGRKNHRKEVLEYLDTREELVRREAELVNEIFRDDPLCMNLALGGQGFSSDDMKALWAKPGYREAILQKQARYWADEENRLKQSDLKKRQYEDQALRDKIREASTKSWSDQQLREDQRQRKTEHWKDVEYRNKVLSSRRSERYSKAASDGKLGDKNPNFGTRWIHNIAMKQSKRILNTDEMPEGWSLGRKMFR